MNRNLTIPDYHDSQDARTRKPLVRAPENRSFGCARNRSFSSHGSHLDHIHIEISSLDMYVLQMAASELPSFDPWARVVSLVHLQSKLEAGSVFLGFCTESEENGR